MYIPYASEKLGLEVGPPFDYMDRKVNQILIYLLTKSTNNPSTHNTGGPTLTPISLTHRVYNDGFFIVKSA